MPDRCMMVVTPDFADAAATLADAVKLLNTYDTPESMSNMPREFWERWIAAANVVQSYGGNPHHEDAQG